MDFGERHLAGDKDALPALLQADIRGPLDQVVRIAVRNGRKGFCAARDNDHPVVPCEPLAISGADRPDIAVHCVKT